MFISSSWNEGIVFHVPTGGWRGSINSGGLSQPHRITGCNGHTFHRAVSDRAVALRMSAALRMLTRPRAAHAATRVANGSSNKIKRAWQGLPNVESSEQKKDFSLHLFPLSQTLRTAKHVYAPNTNTATGTAVTLNGGATQPAKI